MVEKQLLIELNILITHKVVPKTSLQCAIKSCCDSNVVDLSSVEKELVFKLHHFIYTNNIA